MSSDEVTIEVDGVSIRGRKGQMLIELTDQAGIYIPRFCYHKKLSIAANCRMCLVEMERAPKPVPACATPVADGMKVFTRSPKAIDAQQGTMEFLLINHPLDCPICDQGGECELQDLALGFGQDASRYDERKRVVPDPDLGPLVATDMTRCIHCTRCVRFGEEIAGLRELGATGRGEFMAIGTYVEHALTSEVAGNVIDLCPVGALTAKPSRYTARPWELTERPTLSPHDGWGTHIAAHVRGGRVMRVVPREAEAFNETWISDRDRFSYTALQAEDRLLSPMVREDGRWRTVDWATALHAAAEGLRGIAPEALGILASPSATVEEYFLLRRLAEHLECANLDHRLGMVDASAQEHAGAFPDLGRPVAEWERVDAALIVGSDLRREVPLLHLRLRKAGLRGARLCVINPLDADFRFPIHAERRAKDLAEEMAALALAVSEFTGQSVPVALAAAVQGVSPEQPHVLMAEALTKGERSGVLIGQLALEQKGTGVVLALASFVAEATGSTLGTLPVGGNTAGAWLCGIVPHRGFGGAAVQKVGRSAHELFAGGMDGFLMLGLEPEVEAADPAAAMAALSGARFGVALTAYVTDALRSTAHVLLPIGSFAETAGSLITRDGTWLHFEGCTPPAGESRPAWKVLRVLGNQFGATGFDYADCHEVTEAARLAIGEIETAKPQWHRQGAWERPLLPALQRLGPLALYGCDPLARRARALQSSPEGRRARTLHLHPSDAERYGLKTGHTAIVRQGGQVAELPWVADEGLATGCVWWPAGHLDVAGSGARFGAIEIAPGATESTES
ncbi:MAG TPA: NADH-quinone oxidoreductase subunit NuoG [Candidatus Macondimonas sp.]|nr:NADH-quinone oxidoreductase subunit NuoG [Candidatus Macondimonas sp.]